jgi:metallo-beta-lactamase class B
MLHRALLTVSLTTSIPHVAAADAPFPAHRVAGNTYYVGSRDLATYLIATPEGHFLINSGFEETVPLIRGAVESLGFKLSDVKYLLASHAHDDHVAGHAKLRALTGAKVLVMAGDDAVIVKGGEGQYLYTTARWPACPVDRVLKDGEAVKLGGATLVARSTPGHTRGCTTWTWQETVDGKPLEVVVIGSPNVNPGYRLVDNNAYPTIAADYDKTFAVLKSLPCDLFLGAHGNYYGMHAKYERLEKKDTANPFIDPQGYKAYVDLKEAAFRKVLAEQQAQTTAIRAKAAELENRVAASIDEAALIEQLEKVGAKFTRAKDVITSVRIDDLAKFADTDFQALGKLKTLKVFSSSGEKLDDRTLAYLTGLTALEDISTNAAQFTDVGLKQFTAFKNVRQIKFFHTSLRRKDFNGSGLAELAALPNLRALTVAGCPFDDAGMAAVGKLVQLENFRTWHTYQTEAGNVHLKSLVNLKSLMLGQRLRRYGGDSNAHSLTDASLENIVGLKSLDTLTLMEQKFSLSALEKLKALPNLKRLSLTQVDLSADDVEKLKAALPSVKVDFKPMDEAERGRFERILAP